MSRLMSSDNPLPEVVELHSLHELCSATTHTYPPANAMLAGIDHDDCCPSVLGTMPEGRIRKEGLGLSSCTVPLTWYVPQISEWSPEDIQQSSVELQR
jgi:hypothetical protein